VGFENNVITDRRLAITAMVESPWECCYPVLLLLVVSGLAATLIK